MAKNTVIVSVLGDTRDLQSKLGGANSSFDKFARAATAAAAIAVAAVGAIGVKAVRSASELEQSMGAMESVFKGNSAQMEKWATGAASSLGLAKSEYASLATVLGSQMKNMGVATDQLGGQTHQLIGLGADLAAQFGGSTSDAVSALSSLLRGERDPIERYGVSINEAAVKAKMAEMGLAGLTGEAEKNAKLSATLALLYAQTADAQGAFARESTTLAGAQQRLAAGTENLYATLGTSLLPAVTAVTAALGSMVNKLQESEWFATLTANLTAASNSFADFVFGILNGTTKIDFGKILDGLIPALVQGIQNASAWISGGGLQPILASIAAGRDGLLQAAVALFKSIAEALPQILPAVVEALLTFVQDLVTFVVDSVPVLLDAAVQLFTALVDSLAVVLPVLIEQILAMLPSLVETILGLVPLILDAAVLLFTALVDAIPIILPPLIESIVATLPMLVETILGLIPTILDAAINLFTALVDSIPIILPQLLLAIVQLLPTIVSTVISLVPALIGAAVRLFMALVTAVPRIMPQLIQAIGAMWPQMQGALGQIGQQLVAAGGQLMAGLAAGLWNGAGNVVNNLLSIARNAIREFKNFLGIRSPSRVFAAFGVNIDEGLAGGIGKGIGVVKKAVTGLSDTVTDGFDPTFDLPGVPGRGGGGSYGTGGSGVVPRVYQITVHAVSNAYETGRAIVEAIETYERIQGGRPEGAPAL